MSEATGESTPKTVGREFNIVGAKATDSLGTTNWKEYLDKEKLLAAWMPPEGSPYRRFQKTQTIDAIGQLAEVIKPRYSAGESTSEGGGTAFN